MPERVQGRLETAVGELWAAAQVEAAELLVAEREAMAARLRAGDEVLDEALAQLDVAQAEMARLQERLDQVENGASPERA